VALRPQVTGVDITRSRVEGSRRLTEYVKLTDRVRFVEADATRLPMPNGGFTACISQEAFVHIRNKRALFSECFRMLGKGGTLAFTDWVATARLSGSERNRLRGDFAADGLTTTDDYTEALEGSSFSDIGHEDLSDGWARILAGRLEMYRSLREETVARFGNEHFERYDRNYAFFVELVETGKLGGARFTAVRP
jgi:SAM-dependent methyltransferase